MKKKTKWICALLTTAVTFCCAATVAACTVETAPSASESTIDASSSPISGNNSSTKPGDVVVTEGVETGVYYYDADGAESLINLYGGNAFTLNTSGKELSGTYTVKDGAITFTWSKDSKDTLSATYANDVLTVVYNGNTSVYLRKKSFTVTFNVDGGSDVEAATVTNGKTLAKPADPVKEGYAFVGWYTDSNYTTPFLFGTRAVTGDITLYAQWVETTPGRTEYNVTLDANYDGATAQTMQTVNGKLYGVTAPEREGYTFVGWWVSQYNDPEKLSYQYTSDTVFAEDATLFAVWKSATTGNKLATPTVSVNEKNITWDSVSGATGYAIVIASESGEIKNETVPSNIYTFSFAELDEGEYTVSVTAIAATSANNSDASVVYYKNKSLARVCRFSIIDGTKLSFEGVANAEKYYITVECGNSEHTHIYYDNGSSTVYDFANCDMKEGGIKFTVTATAEGYLSSESATFTYNRTLSAVQNLTFDESTQLLTWDAVSDATEYIVSLGNGTEEEEYITESVGNKTYYSLKNYTGNIVINVYPKTKGYNSPVATTLTVNKTILATPNNVAVTGNVITWTEVTGATGYAVKLDGVTVAENTTAASFDASAYLTEAGKEYKFSVQALGAQPSAWSDDVAIRYAALTSATYENGVLSWDRVAGAESYEVKVNNGNVQTIVGKNSADVTLTQSGDNTIAVRFYNGTEYSEWVEITVKAYAVSFVTAGGEAISPVYRAEGDTLNLPEATRTGYDFGGWYNAVAGAAGNAAKYDSDSVFDQDSDIIIYADWKAQHFTVTLNAGDDNATQATVVFGKLPTLATVESANATQAFGGWYTEPNGKGEQYVDAYGNAVKEWDIASDVTLYAKWYTAFTFTALSDGTYSVKMGADIAQLTKVTVPASYNNKAVTVVDSYAFKNTTLTEINIPDTVTIVESTAFYNCKSLQNVNVYTTGTMLEEDIIYRSTDGVLAKYEATDSAWEIAFYPLGKTGAYVIPDYIGVVPLKAFSGKSITSITIPYSVFRIDANAFNNCQKLTEVIFSATPDGVTAQDIQIADTAFSACSKLTDVTLPARMTTFSNGLFDNATNLTSINVEEGSKYYTSVEGYLCSADRLTLAYAPKGKSGDITLPVGIKQIGANAFENCAKITSITVPNWVTYIGEEAFKKCTKLTSVTIEGDTLSSLIIDANAFSGCTLTELNIAADANLTAIGEGAFQNLKIDTLTLPASLVSVGKSAFTGGTFRKVVFANGENELTLSEYAFSECESLKEITLPKTLTSFDASVFDGCVSLTKLVIDDDNQKYTTDSGVVLTKDETTVIYCAPNKTDYAIPNTVTTIGDYAFADCSVLENIIIPSSVVNIGRYAFHDCISLTQVLFKAGSTQALTVGEYAFAGATSLTTISLPDRLTAISDYMFYNDKSLATISFSKVTEIGKSAFEGAAALTAIDLTGVTAIGNGAFKDSGLTSITLPESIQEVGEYVLSGSYITSAVIKGYQVIGKNAFQNCAYLETVTIEEGVAELPEYVFDGCISLTSITIPKSVTNIGNYAFNNCKNLATLTFVDGGTENLYIGNYAFQNWGISVEEGVALNLPARTYSIADNAFSNPFTSPGTNKAANIVGTVTIPKNVNYLGAQAFLNCTKLEEVIFEDGETPLFLNDRIFGGCSALKTAKLSSRITNLSAYLFNNCSVLEEVEIPASVTTIHQNAFFNANKELNVTLEEGSQNYQFIDGILYGMNEAKKPVSIAFVNFNVESKVTIPNTVTEIPSYSFRYITALKEVEFEADRAEKLDIKSYAFYYCTGLESIHLPVLASLESNAFNHCTALTSLIFDEGAETDSLVISDSATFSYATSLTSLTLPAYITSIGKSAFSYSSALASLTFAENSRLTTIVGSAFASTALTEVVIPDSVTTMGSSAFGSCKSLTKVVLPKSLAAVTGTTLGGYFTSSTALKEISISEDSENYSVRNNLVYDKDGTTLLWAPYGLTGTLTLDSETKAIGEKAFNAHANLTKIVVPASVTEIGNYAFASMTKLTTVEFEAGTETLTFGEYAFNKATLTSITIPARADISDAIDIFASCTKLTKVIFEGDKENPAKTTAVPNLAFSGCTALTSVTLPYGITTIGLQAFASCTKLASITIPATVTTFASSANGSAVGASNGAFSKCTALKTVTFEEGSVLTDTSGAFSGASALTTIKNWPSGITTIGTYTFYGCTAMTDFSSFLKEGITSIGGFAFNGCTKITAFTIPSTVTSIGNNAFAGCTGVKSMTIPENVTTLGEQLFSGDSALTSVTLPSTLTAVPARLFYNCSALTSATIPAGVTSMGTYVFYNCGKLVEVTLPDGITKLPDSTFMSCKALTTVNFNGTLTEIGTYAFSGCTALESFDMGNSVTSIGNYAFQNCTALTNCPISEATETIGTSAFLNCSNLAIEADLQDLKSIGNTAFSGCSSLISVRGYESLTSVGNSAFLNCSSLKTFYIPGSLTKLGTSPFSGCSSLESIELDPSNTSFVVIDSVLYNAERTNILLVPAQLTGNIVIPDTVTSIAASAFAGTAITGVSFEGRLTSIANSTFANCTSLTSLTLPSGLTTIGNNAFDGCTSLAINLVIPRTVTLIGDYAFNNCPLTALTFEKGGADLVRIGGYAFANADITTLEIPLRLRTDLKSTVYAIGIHAFENNTKLETITYEAGNDPASTVFTMGDYAFTGCTALKELAFTKSLKNAWYTYTVSGANATATAYLGAIGAYAFKGCTALEKVSFEKDITRSLSTGGNDKAALGNGVFSGCTALKDITFQNYVEFYRRTTGGSSTSGSVGLFEDCESLETISLTDVDCTNITLAKDMFKGCTSLKEVDGGRFAAVGESAFEGCTALTKVRSDSSITRVNASAFKDCTNFTTLACAGDTGAISEVGANAFENCTSLTSFTFTSTITVVKIGNYAFKGCTALKEVTGVRLSTVGQSAFEGCTALTKFEFTEASVLSTNSSIGADAFKGCTALASVTFLGEKWTVGEGAFSGWTAEQTIKFADLSEATETFAEGWSGNATVVYGVVKAETEPETNGDNATESGAEA